MPERMHFIPRRKSLIPDICRILVHHRIIYAKWESIRNEIAKNFAFPMRKKYWLISAISRSLSNYFLPCFYLLLTINIRIRVAQADEALPFNRIPHDAPTSAICYIAVCTAQYTVCTTHPWFFCSEVLTPGLARTHPERCRSTLRKWMPEKYHCDISLVHNSAARVRLFAKANLWIYITRVRKLESFVLVCERKSWVSFH